jgi:tRNA pseudouridine38-40 synthase
MLDSGYSFSTAPIKYQKRTNKQRRRIPKRPAAGTKNTATEMSNTKNKSNVVYDYSSCEEEVIREYKLPYKYIAEVAYDGTRYSGFQLQNASSSSFSSSSSNSNSTSTVSSFITSTLKPKQRHRQQHPPPTIQGKLETALTKFLAIHRDDLLLQGAGRTDAGVHARGQVVHFFSKRLLHDTTRAVVALNSLLPEDIHVLDLLRVPLDYNVRFSMGKIYTYDLHLDPMGSDPFTQRYRLCPPRALLNNSNLNFNVEALSAAAAEFVGTHDFSVFSSKPRDRSQRTPVRTIRRCEIVATPSSSLQNSENFSTPLSSDPFLLRIEVEGDGFLYKQVRHMVGAMLAVAAGRITCEDISKALADPINKGEAEGGALARPGAYVLAEPRGLCLNKVFLPDPGNPDELMYGEQGPVLKRRSELVELLQK